jgi:orotate phosphoribosyltransferase
VNEAEAHGLLESCGALLGGHFLLTSGRHSDTYVEKARVFEHPGLTMRAAQELAAGFADVQAVVSPALGAIPLGFAVALEAGARFLFAEREDDRMALRRGFALSRGERTLVVEDVLTTGASAGEVLDLVRGSGAEALGVAALVDRTTEPLRFNHRALLRVEARSWPPEDCPLCRDGVPLAERGSRHI